MTNTPALKPSEKPHYVNNAKFSEAVVEYKKSVHKAADEGSTKPQVTNYIASCFLKISEGLSHKANFVRYTYREEMVMDAVENCLKAIENYNIEAATRTGKPNAFAYFTQIVWYAFLRRIQKEKKHQDIKIKYMTEYAIEESLQEELANNPAAMQTKAFIEELKGRIDFVKQKDEKVKEFVKKEKTRRFRSADSDLTEFL